MATLNYLHNGDVGSGYEAHQADAADDDVFDDDPGWKVICVEGEDL